MNTVLAIWPIAKWVLQALGLLGPEDKEAERTFQLKLLAAQEENRRALTEAFQQFQVGWRPAAERVSVWGNTLIALFQPALLALVYYDVIWGDRRSIKAAIDLEAAGIPGLLIMSIMLFPFYGPALVQGVQNAFGAAVDLVVTKRRGGVRNGLVPGQPVKLVVDRRKPLAPVDDDDPQPETERERLERLNRERNVAIIREREERIIEPEGRELADDPDPIRE